MFKIKYRIKKRTYLISEEVKYIIQRKRFFFWWDYSGFDHEFDTLLEARKYLKSIKEGYVKDEIILDILEEE